MEAKTRRIKEKGLTLFELMLSLALFALVLVSSVAVLTSSNNLSESSRQRLVALNAARTILEQVKDTQLTQVPFINTVAPNALPNGNVGLNLTWAGQAQGVPLTAVDSATVTVTVTWTGAKNIPGIVQLSTIRSRFS